ncbi:transmembrane Fragile-X-F protein [Lactobacillus gasseri]|uniref:transmembrane Fragile-X-F protein n=1 Tax=Lactobacillus gasseri TaxID=1596 RepID=UPI0016664076|nr:transmembrane Fragile-X-F protein [Lactobacillus gasseri]MBD0888704.1 transmembrane Fragile-X-F protein [Lactobacillus gasseri]
MKFLAVILTIIFTIARIMNLITWSWWLVLSPALVYFGVIVLFFVVMGIVCLIYNLIDKIRESKWK